MKVYVVEEYINDYEENGGGYQGIAHIFSDEKKAQEFCAPPCLFPDWEPDEGEVYFKYYGMEVE